MAHKNIEIDPVKYMEDGVKVAHEVFEKQSKPAFRRYPFLFGSLAALGALFVMYGFERFADKIALFSENPGGIFVIGVLMLLMTGTLYKKIKH